MKSSLILLLVFGVHAFGAVAPWESTVRLDGNQVIGVPAAKHYAKDVKLEIWDQEKCSASVQGRMAKLSGDCQYLRGALRYQHKVGELEVQLIQVFALTRKGNTESYMVDSPIEIVPTPG